jgi:DNA repair exonuclease SbcCD nuclease subunit
VTIRILALGDSQRDPHSRAAEHDRVLDYVAAEVERRRPDVVAHGGDWTERKPIHEDREYLFRWARRIAKTCPLVGVEGNHEEPRFCDEFRHLDVERPVVVATSPCVEMHGGAAFALMPWPSRAALYAYMTAHGMPTSRGDANLTANAMLRDVLRGFANCGRLEHAGSCCFSAAPADMPRVLVIHAEPAVYEIDADQPTHVAAGMKVAIEDMVILTGCDIALVSHIHKFQSFTVTRSDDVVVPVVLIGSPGRTAYANSEAEPKGVLWVEFDGRVATWSRILTPATPMILVEATWDLSGDVGAFRSINDTLFPADVAR